jgi:hypothetical protein
MTFYTPSGRINFLRAMIPLPFILLLIFGLSWALHGLYQNEIAIPLIWYAVLGFVMFLVTFGFVYFGHVRNRVVASVAGFFLPAMTILGFYHINMVQNLKFVDWSDVSQLPDWILFHLNRYSSEVIHQNLDRVDAKTVHELSQILPPQNKASEFFLIWKFSEFFLTCLFPAIGGWVGASTPYCEKYKQWFAEHRVRLRSGSAERLLKALLNEMNFEELKKRVEFPKHSNSVQDTLIVYYLYGIEDTQVFVSEMSPEQQGNKQFSNFATRAVELTIEQAIRLAVLLKLPQARFVPTQELPVGTQDSTKPSGKIFSLADGQSGLIFTERFKYQSLFVQLSPLIFAVILSIGIGIMAYLIWGQLDFLLKIVVIAPIPLMLVSSVTYLLFYETYLPTIRLERHAKKIISLRGDSLIDPETDDAWLVEHIPRANWNRMMVENSIDRGFIYVDLKRQAIFFEGDIERWVLPKECIESITLENFQADQNESTKFNTWTAVVIRATVDGNIWEAPVIPKIPKFQVWLREQRREAAESLRVDLASML